MITLGGIHGAERAATAAGLKVGTRRDGDRYVGVLRRDRAIVAECGHTHPNRDLSTRSSGESASDCMRGILYAAQKPAVADERATEIANQWRNLGRGFAISVATIDTARAEAPANVAAYRELVAKVADLLGVASADVAVTR